MCNNARAARVHVKMSLCLIEIFTKTNDKSLKTFSFTGAIDDYQFGNW